MGSILAFVFQLVVFIFSVMVHEISHGFVAEKLGDKTARLAGRLTLNPLVHLDPFGSILLPISLYFLTGGGFVLGWAKPVPYNPENLRDPRVGGAKIAAAGPLSNLFLAVVFGVMTRIILSFIPFLAPLASFFAVIVYINVLLAVFNLVPLPPLDGSKVLFALLPKGESSYRLQSFLERYGIALLLVFIVFGFDLIIPPIRFLFSVIVGHSFGL